VFRTLSLGDFDVVIATSPQFFCAVAGWLAAGVLRAPWVFELRDIWPESISAVGAMSLSPVLRFLEALELRMYASAQAVVCVTRSFVENLARRGIPREKLHFIPNGIEPDAWAKSPSGSRDKFGLRPSDFVCAYVGTIGMAHGLGTVLEAAKGLQRDRPEIKFLLAGDGAERARLAQLAQSWGLSNVIFAGLVPHDVAQSLLLESDVALVLLKKSDLFETVIPSKLLEALAAGRPVILGVAGEARQILQEANAGLPIDPEDAIGLRAAVETLAGSAELRRQMGENGRAYVSSRFDRKSWSRVFLDVLARLAGRGVLARTAGM
jgi:glycosyltransferase involved in cell wall biosynthesis